MSAPIPSTARVYKPGVGFTITRANIDWLQEDAVKNGRKPYTSEEVLLALMKVEGVADAKNLIEPRHLGRVYKLMMKG